MKVAVTGAGGFLGKALVARLRDCGHEPLAVVKSRADASEFEDNKIAAICRDLSDESACADIFGGCQAIVHCAALTRDFGRWEDFKKSNIDTTRNVLETALKSNSEKVIHISTTYVYGNERNHYGTDEDADYGQRVVDFYTRSKIESDRLALSFIQQKGLPGVVLRFGNIWGPGDPSVIPFIVESLKARRLTLEGDGQNVLSLTFIDNAVEGVMLALRNDGVVGNVFNITDGGKVTSRKFISDIISVLGIEYRLRSISYPLLYSAAYWLERYYLLRRFDKNPPLTRFAARFLKYSAIFDISRAINNLDYHPLVSYREALTKSTPYIRALYYGRK